MTFNCPFIPIILWYDFECLCVCVFSCVWLFASSMDSLPSSLSMKFSKQEYCSGLPFPTLLSVYESMCNEKIQSYKTITKVSLLFFIVYYFLTSVV